MSFNEVQKLNLLARFSRKEFFLHGSSLSHTKLGRFILVAFLLHASVVIFQLLILISPKNSSTPPPIKIKYVRTQKPESVEPKNTRVDTPKSKKIPNKKLKSPALLEKADIPKSKKISNKKLKPPALLKKSDNKARIKKQYPNPKKYRRKNTTAPQVKRKPDPIQQTRARVKPDKAISPKNSEQKTLQTPSAFLGSQERVLSMLDGLNPEKYISKDSQIPSEKGSSDDKPIPLDTKEEKYVSYFNRIKQQIQRTWVYPAQAAKRKISGELTLRFEISRDGNLLGLRLVDTSGFEILDIAATKAVKEAAPYYPFPLTISKKKLSILATFVYSPNQYQLNAE